MEIFSPLLNFTSKRMLASKFHPELKFLVDYMGNSSPINRADNLIPGSSNWAEVLARQPVLKFSPCYRKLLFTRILQEGRDEISARLTGLKVHLGLKISIVIISGEPRELSCSTQGINFIFFKHGYIVMFIVSYQLLRTKIELVHMCDSRIF